MVLEQVFVEGHVFVFGQYGIVRLEAVFGEHGFIARQIGSVCCERRGDGMLELTLGLEYLKRSHLSV